MAKLAQGEAQRQATLRQALVAIEDIEGDVQGGLLEKIADKLTKVKGALRTLVTPSTGEGEDEKTRQLTPKQQARILSVLEHRLGQKPDHYTRPKGINAAEVRKALEATPAALWSIYKMDSTGGCPDVVSVEEGAFVFADCSAESPEGRRNCVYDNEAEKHASGTVNGNAVDMAEEFGVDLWSEDFYRTMQKSGKFDRGTWSWVKTPADLRESGRALFGYRGGDCVGVRRYDARSRDEDGGWRGVLRVPKA